MSGEAHSTVTLIPGDDNLSTVTYRSGRQPGIARGKKKTGPSVPADGPAEGAVVKFFAMAPPPTRLGRPCSRIVERADGVGRSPDCAGGIAIGETRVVILTMSAAILPMRTVARTQPGEKREA